MSKKDFMRGVEVTAKANEAFMRKQAAATEELAKRVIQKIDEQGKIIDVILDTLNTQEKKELYDLQSEYDIADLGENEKEVLTSFLLTLIAKYGQGTENQKEYYFAVKKHLGVTDVSADFNLELVENVDSRSELKAMFQTVCEFLFLKTGDTSFMDEFEEELDYFGLTRKAVREIVEPIEKIYDILGLRGIVEHYIPAEAEEEQVPEHYGLIQEIEGELIFDDSNRDIPVGTEKVFENLQVIIPKQLHVDGKAIFKNCIIVLDYEGSVAICGRENESILEFYDCEFVTQKQTKAELISSCGRIMIKNSNFSGLKYRYGMKDDVFTDKDDDPVDYNMSFIDVDGYDETAVLIMEHCHIENCEGTFINADGNRMGDNFNIEVNDCLIEGHTGNFLLARYGDRGYDTGVKITNCTFRNSKAYEMAEDWDFKYKNFTALLEIDSNPFICENTLFDGSKEDVFKTSWTLSDVSLETIGCTFNNICQKEPILGLVKNCRFSAVIPVIGKECITFGKCGEFGNNETFVRDSQFDNLDGIVMVKYGKIENCIFTNSTVKVKLQGKPNGRDSYTSEANNVQFENCIALAAGKYGFTETTCFMQAESYLDKIGDCVMFRGCKFKNCKTDGEYINTDNKIYGAFDRIKTISIGREYGTVID